MCEQTAFGIRKEIELRLLGLADRCGSVDLPVSAAVRRGQSLARSYRTLVFHGTIEKKLDGDLMKSKF